MSEEIRQLVDLDDRALVNVHFGRNRFLRALGIAIFGYVVQMVAPETAHAYHGSTPYPCFGFGQCHCCSGTSCCTTDGCQAVAGVGCPGGGQCWTTCASNNLWRCCDWKEKPCPTCAWQYCICGRRIQTGCF